MDTPRHPVLPTSLHITLLRALYAFIAIGLAFAVWPDIIAPPDITASVKTVVRSLLGAVGLLAVLGVRHPLKMLPLLFFEFIWKLIWVFAFALPMWLGPGLNDYASHVLAECMLGLVLLPLLMPWRYMWQHYVVGPADGAAR